VLILRDAADRFIQLYLRLMHYAGRERRVLPAGMTVDECTDTHMEMKGQCRGAIYGSPSMFEQFLEAHSADLTDQEQALVSVWARHYVRGTLVMLMHRKEHTITRWCATG
jgi:hypothetical protein